MWQSVYEQKSQNYSTKFSAELLAISNALQLFHKKYSQISICKRPPVSHCSEEPTTWSHLFSIS